VRLPQFGFTATDLVEAYMALEGEKGTDSPAADNVLCETRTRVPNLTSITLCR
jgi:hypothetical protein